MPPPEQRPNRSWEEKARRLVGELTLRGPQTRERLMERLDIKSEDTLRKHIKAANKFSGPGEAPIVYDAPAEDAQLPAAVVQEIIDGPGRDASVLMLGRQAGAAVGVELGRSHLSVGVADANGRLLGEPAISDENSIIDAVEPHVSFSRIGKLVKKQLRVAGTDPGEVRGVAVSIPGPVSLHGKTLARGMMHAYKDIPLPEKISGALEKHAGVSATVFVENDVDVLARGEQRYGKGYGLRDFMAIKCSGGIGAGVVSDERIVRGRGGGGAGEIGHCTIGPDVLVTRGEMLKSLESRPKCKCGGIGHLEAYAGGDGIVGHLLEIDARKAGIDLSGTLPSQLGEVMQLALENRGRHLDVVLDAAAMVGYASNLLIHLFNPQRVLICGRLSELGEPFLQAIKEECREQGLLFGSVDSLIAKGTGTTTEERRRISVGGAATTALRKAPPSLTWKG